MKFHGETTDIGPVLSGYRWDAIQGECVKHKRFIVEVRKYDEQKEISRKQMAYLHAVVFPILAEKMDCSLWFAEFWCKKECGQQWELILTVGKGMQVECSKTKLTTKQCNQWIENIHDKAEIVGIHIPPPDKDWRSNELQQSNANRISNP